MRYTEFIAEAQLINVKKDSKKVLKMLSDEIKSSAKKIENSLKMMNDADAKQAFKIMHKLNQLSQQMK